MHLRAAEWINILAFLFFTVLCWLQTNLNQVRRIKITAIGVGGLAIIVVTALLLPEFIPPLAASVTRDWIPYLLLLMFYWQAGQFVTRADLAFETRLERLDQKLVAPLVGWCARHSAGFWILSYLELAYLICYISMPLGLGAVYVLHHGREADRFWAVVLLATYPSYGLLPFIQTRPPRMLGEKWSEMLPCSKIRAFNLWILRHASIHANTFPSAHVASTMSCALVLLAFAPLWVGLIFVLVAVSIALGAVTGRYHYAADAILGAAFAVAAFLVESAIVPPTGG
jgi:hypothetical protein